MSKIKKVVKKAVGLVTGGGGEDASAKAAKKQLEESTRQFNQTQAEAEQARIAQANLAAINSANVNAGDVATILAGGTAAEMDSSAARKKKTGMNLSGSLGLGSL